MSAAVETPAEQRETPAACSEVRQPLGAPPPEAPRSHLPEHVGAEVPETPTSQVRQPLGAPPPEAPRSHLPEHVGAEVPETPPREPVGAQSRGVPSSDVREPGDAESPEMPGSEVPRPALQGVVPGAFEAREPSPRCTSPAAPLRQRAWSADEDEDEAHASLGPIGLLLRSPAEVARRCLDEDDLRPLTLAALAALVIGSAAFGGVVGSFRGGAQIASAATKIPLAMVAALLVCVPAFHAIAASLGRAWPLRTVVSLTVAAAGRAALVLLAFAPVLWLAYDLGLGYHAAALAATGAYAIAGLAALGILLRGLGGGRHQLTTAGAFVLVFMAAAGQTGWLLRPYLVRPQSEEVPLLRAREGGFADALVTSSRSAVGIYERASASARRSSDDWDEALDVPSNEPYSPAPEGTYR